MAADRLAGDVLLVLADEAEQEAAPGQRPEGALQRHVRFADRVVAAEAEVLPPDIADDAPPQRVVQIDEEDLAPAPQDRPQRRLDLGGGGAEQRRREGDLPQVPRLRIERIGAGRRRPAGCI